MTVNFDERMEQRIANRLACVWTYYKKATLDGDMEGVKIRYEGKANGIEFMLDLEGVDYEYEYDDMYFVKTVRVGNSVAEVI